MRTVCILCAIVVGFAASPAAADSVTFSDQGVTFNLDVMTTATMVTADLEVITDSNTDYLQTVTIKIFSSFLTPASVTGPAGHTWGFLDGSRNGGNGGVTNMGTGFVSIDDTDAMDSGPPIDGSTYDFQWKWNTMTAPLTAWSIKAWTADTNDGSFDMNKSRQWSSGELSVPEPGIAVLLSVVLGAFALRRYRRRA